MGFDFSSYTPKEVDEPVPIAPALETYAQPSDFSSSKKFPFSTSFQTKALAVVLRFPSMLQDYVNDIKAGYFTDSTHQNLFRLIQNYYRAYRSAPTKDAMLEMIKQDCEKLGHAEDFKIRMVTLAEEISSIPLDEGKYLEDRVKGFVKFQRAVEVTTKMADLCERMESEGESDFDQIVPLIREMNAIGTKGNMGFSFYDNIESLPERLQCSDNYSSAVKVPIGLSAVDQVLDGGMSAGEIGFFVAGAGVGKSTALTQAAVASSLYGVNVMIYTMELKEEDYALRTMQRLLGVGKSHVIYQSQRFQHRMPALQKLRDEGRVGLIEVKYYPPNRATVDTLRSHFSNMLTTKGNGRPWIVILDYVEKLRMGTDSRIQREDWALIGDTVNDLIAFGHEFGVPVLSASQTNRMGYAKVARSKGRAHTDKDDIGASWKKVEHADLVLAFDQSELEKAAGQARVRTMKIRRGQDGLTFRVKDLRPIMRQVELGFEGNEILSYQPRGRDEDDPLVLELGEWDQVTAFDDETLTGVFKPPAVEIALYKRDQLKMQQHEAEGLDLEQIVAQTAEELNNLGLSGLQTRVSELAGGHLQQVMGSLGQGAQ